MLSPMLLYLLKANGALLLFALAYFGLLRRLTFFTLNRFYLLFALLFSAVYPLLPVPALLPPVAAAPVAVVLMETASLPATGLAAAAPTPTDWNAVALAVYGAGVALGLLRLLVQLLSLARLRRLSRPAVVGGVAVRALPGEVSPFSFGTSIYLNPEQHPAPELAAVLHHEQVHVRQGHTLDVLLAQLAQAAAWCNPAAWLLRRALLDNLEYLADHAALQTGLDRRAYQYSLLRLSQAQPGPALVSHFTLPTLKNRVAMMNTPLSSTGQLARYFVAGPLVLAATLGFSGARAQGAGPVVPPAAQTSLPASATPTTAPQPVDAHAVRITAKAAPAPQSAAKPRPATEALHRRAAFKASLKPEAGQAAPKLQITLDGPKPAGPPPIYYVDGQERSSALQSVNPNDIVSINVFKGDKARQVVAQAGEAGVVIITTKQNENSPEVRAFNEKLGIASAAAPAQPAASVPYLAAPALAYITQHYPDARLLGVTELKAPNGGPSRYQAEIVIGRRPGYVLFDGAGKFISESYTR